MFHSHNRNKRRLYKQWVLNQFIHTDNGGYILYEVQTRHEARYKQLRRKGKPTRKTP